MLKSTSMINLLKYVLSVNAVNVVDEVRLLRLFFSRIINFRSPRRLAAIVYA
jgi:hypothetical protein